MALLGARDEGAQLRRARHRRHRSALLVGSVMITREVPGIERRATASSSPIALARRRPSSCSWAAWRCTAQRLPPVTGVDGLVGARRPRPWRRSAPQPPGQVRVRGEIWRAVERAAGAGRPARVRVVARRRADAARASRSEDVVPQGGDVMIASSPVLILVRASSLLYLFSSIHDPEGVRARRRLPPRQAAAAAEGPGHRPRVPADRQHRAGQPAHRRARRAAAGHHHARQRLGEGQRRRLLPRGRSAARHRRGRELHLRHVAARPDDAAQRARAGRARRSAGRARAAEPGAAADPRQPDRSVGHQGVGGRGEARRPAGGHAAGHGPSGRSRAREARQDHPRRGRADRLREAVAGGRRHRHRSRAR